MQVARSGTFWGEGLVAAPAAAVPVGPPVGETAVGGPALGKKSEIMLNTGGTGGRCEEARGMPGWVGQGDHFNLLFDGLGGSSAGEAKVHETCSNGDRG